ncbi:MAG: SurA N-terminal domain-containing protein, partial [Chloroflexota bacterium]|nr:SurA N-terminal domain-containing protein [Chloroflexota bacterium]
MAKRNPPIEEVKELTRKEVRLRARDRDRNRRLYLGTGVAIGLALLLVIVGLVSEFVLKPNSTLAKVGDDAIITQDFWKRTKLEQGQAQNQLIRMQQMEEQFGNQGFFTQQINQLQSTLSSPFALGMQVLNQMIDEKVIAQQAAALGITVSEEEVDEALREEVAARRSALTVPQATQTAEAATQATATAVAGATATAAAPAVTNTIAISGSTPVTATTIVTAPATLTTTAAMTTPARVT